MTFVDANVFVYAVGNPHPLKSVAQAFSETSVEDGTLLCTSLIGLVQDKICVTNPPSSGCYPCFGRRNPYGHDPAGYTGGRPRTLRQAG
jgi:hypothetical protein